MPRSTNCLGISVLFWGVLLFALVLAATAPSTTTAAPHIFSMGDDTPQQLFTPEDIRPLTFAKVLVDPDQQLRKYSALQQNVQKNQNQQEPSNGSKKK